MNNNYKNVPHSGHTGKLSVLFLFLVVPLSAQVTVTVVNPAGNSINWDGPGWSPSAPGVLDSVLIAQEKSVSVTTSGHAVASVQVANSVGSWDDPSFLNVRNGGSLSVGALILSNADPAGDDGIVVVETGGALTNSGALTINAGGTLRITGGTYTDSRNLQRSLSTGAGLIEITGGAMVANSTDITKRVQIQSDMVINGGTLSTNARFQLYNTLTIVGSNSAVIGTDLQQGTTQATIKWVFDAAGVSAMNFSGFFQAETLTIDIDGSSYAGGPGTFTLVSASSISTLFNPANLTVTGLGSEGVGWNWLADSDSLAIQVVPEPASVAFFFGVLALGCVGWRRYR